MPHYCGIPQSEEEEKSDKADEQRLGKVRLLPCDWETGNGTHTTASDRRQAEANRVALTKETVC